MKLVSYLGFQLIMFLIVSSCKEDEIDFEREVVLVGVDSAVSTIAAFDIIFGEGLTIRRTIGFSYGTYYPPDSLNYIKQSLKSKSYLKTDTLSVTIVDGSISIKIRMLEMEEAERKDWILTMFNLSLFDVSEGVKWVTVSVPFGSEEKWVEFFSKKSIVISASLIRNPTADN